MTENRIAVFWDPARPTTIVDQAFLDRSIPQAMARGIEVIFAIYPLKARALVDTPNGVQLFAQYAARVAQRYPYVRKVICLNEGNQPRFHQPQFDDAGNGISGFVQEQAMAACYDALEVGRSRDHRDRVRALASRQRRLRRAEQRLALARSAS